MSTDEHYTVGKTEHTPGPWRANIGGIYTNSKVHDKDGWDIAKIYAMDEEKANAKLIAAAPELLDCLQQFVFLEEGMDAMFKPQIIKEAKAAIAKARSQS